MRDRQHVDHGKETLHDALLNAIKISYYRDTNTPAFVKFWAFLQGLSPTQYAPTEFDKLCQEFKFDNDAQPDRWQIKLLYSVCAPLFRISESQSILRKLEENNQKSSAHLESLSFQLQAKQAKQQDYLKKKEIYDSYLDRDLTEDVKKAIHQHFLLHENKLQHLEKKLDDLDHLMKDENPDFNRVKKETSEMFQQLQDADNSLFKQQSKTEEIQISEVKIIPPFDQVTELNKYQTEYTDLCDEIDHLIALYGKAQTELKSQDVITDFTSENKAVLAAIKQASDPFSNTAQGEIKSSEMNIKTVLGIIHKNKYWYGNGDVWSQLEKIAQTLYEKWARTSSSIQELKESRGKLIRQFDELQMRVNEKLSQIIIELRSNRLALNTTRRKVVTQINIKLCEHYPDKRVEQIQSRQQKIIQRLAELETKTRNNMKKAFLEQKEKKSSTNEIISKLPPLERAKALGLNFEKAHIKDKNLVVFFVPNHEMTLFFTPEAIKVSKKSKDSESTPVSDKELQEILAKIPNDFKLKS